MNMQKGEASICDLDLPPEGAIVISPSELKNRLKEIISYGKRTGTIIPVFIFGPPGVGKTDIVNEIGKELSMQVQTYIASTMDPTEIRGIPYPYPERGYSEWYPQRSWIENPQYSRESLAESAWVKHPGIFFFDELNLATKATEAAFYRLILEGKLDTIDISNSMRIAAGNEKSQIPEVKEMNMALTTRFEIYYVRADAKSWLAWAKTHNVEEVVIDYITEHPGQILCTNRMKPDIAKATPRSWTRVSQLLKIGLNTKEDIAGSVGRDPANKFLSFMAKKPERKVPDFGKEKFGGI